MKDPEICRCLRQLEEVNPVVFEYQKGAGRSAKTIVAILGPNTLEEQKTLLNNIAEQLLSLGFVSETLSGLGKVADNYREKIRLAIRTGDWDELIVNIMNIEKNCPNTSLIYKWQIFALELMQHKIRSSNFDTAIYNKFSETLLLNLNSNKSRKHEVLITVDPQGICLDDNDYVNACTDGETYFNLKLKPILEKLIGDDASFGPFVRNSDGGGNFFVNAKPDMIFQLAAYKWVTRIIPLMR